MATPASGTISMLNMRSEITRGTGAISMSEVRTRYGGSGAISFNELYACEGFVQTNGSTSTKFVTFNGWHAFQGPTGSVTPNESGGTVVVVSSAPGSRIYSNFQVSGQANAVLGLANNTNGSTISSGWQGTNIVRMVCGNTARTIVSQAAAQINWQGLTMPSSGSLHNLVKF